MRDLLTGLAIILIVVLTTMLVAPYVVDWNGQRGVLETQLSRALGQKVTIGGDIDVRLLPTPYLRLNQTVIGGDDAPLRIGVRHLDFELAVAPLLHGEIDIVEGRLEEPTMRLVLQSDRTLPALPTLPAHLDVRLERITIVDGTLAVADPSSGRTLSADHLDFTVEAPGLAGPYKASGTQGLAEMRSRFRLFAGVAQRTGEASRTRVRFAVDETARHPAINLDGDLELTSTGAGKLAERFQGATVVAGHLRAEGHDPVGWQLRGPLRADPQGAGVADGELRIGSGEGDLVFKATLVQTLGEAPKLDARLEAKQLDIDRLAGRPVSPDQRPAPPRLPRLAALRGLMAGVAVPLPVAVAVKIDTAIWGGETLDGLSAEFGLGATAPQPFHLAGDGPGGLHLDISGIGAGHAGNDASDAVTTFDGGLALAATDAPTALRWLRTVAPEGAIDAGVDTPFRALALAGRVVADDNDVALRDLTLKLDRSTLHGSAQIALAAPRGNAAGGSVVADLSTTLLDLDALPELRALRGDTPFDLALKLDAGSLKVARAGSGSLAAGHVRLDLKRTGSRLVVNDFVAENLGGATLHASGSVDPRAATLALDVDAAHLEAAAALVRQLAPGRAADALAARAGALAPAKLHLAAAFVPAGPDGLAPSRLDLAGDVAATALAIHLVPDGKGIRLDATADAARGDTLLEQIGLPVVPREDGALPGAKSAGSDSSGAGRMGRGQLKLSAAGRVDGALDTHVQAAFGPSRLACDGSFELFAAGRGGSGAVALSSPDAIALLQALGLASPDQTDSLPVQLTGGLALGQSGLAVSDLKGQIAGRRIAGTLRWQSVAAPGDDPTLTGSLDIDRLGLAQVFGLTLGPARQLPSGAAWSSEPFTAGLPQLPRGLVALHVKELDLGFGLQATQAALDLTTGPGAVGVTHAGGHLAGGRIDGEATLRRDGRQATLVGTMALSDVRLDLPSVQAKLSGKLDVAGGGVSPFVLLSSLAGSGQATFAGTKLTGFDAGALAKVFAETEADTLAVDGESIRRALDEANPGGAILDAGTRHLAVNLTSGQLAFTPKDPPLRAGPIAATPEGSYDLRRLSGALRVTQALTTLPKGWTGPAPSVTVTVAGLPTAAKRSFDVGEFINAVAARAIARESVRIETFEFDVRERALFNARLLFDRRREQDRLRVEADAKAAAAEAVRRAEAEARTRADAARLARERRPEVPPGDAPTLQDPAAAGGFPPTPRF